MQNPFLYAGAATFLLAGYLLFSMVFGSRSPDDFIYASAMWLHSPIRFGIVAVLIVALSVFMHLVLGEGETYEQGAAKGDASFVAWVIGSALFLFITFGYVAGGAYAERIEKGCQFPGTFPMACHYNGEKRVTFDLGWNQEIAGWWLVVFLVVPPAIAGLLVGNIKTLLAGFVSMTTTHPAASSVTRAASTNQPTSVHVELARVMRGQEVDYMRAHSLINQMNPLQQFIARVRYSKQIKEAKRLEEMVRKRTEAMRADTKLYSDTLDMEVQKRGRK